MNTLLASSCNELQKLMAKKVTRLFLVTSALLPFLIKLLVHKLFITDWMALPAENINFSVLDLFVSIFLPIFCFIAATDLFTGEAERGTLIQVRPISRIELFLSKTLAICLFLGIQLLTVWLSLMISSALFDQFFSTSMMFTSLGAFLLSLVPLIVLTAMAILLALVVNSSVIAISSMIVLYLVMVFLPYVLPNVLYLLPTSYLDWYMQWLGNMSFRWLIQTVTYLCSTFALFFSTGYYIFNKKEV
ncbi:MAG: ABC transporter permease [Bacillus sp. (in: Bacteria)]|nr:ABC transporter permease [Bacillus sp. (in: firmicutes)]